MHKRHKRRTMVSLLLTLVLITSVSCGGGGGGGSTPPPAPTPTFSIGGTASGLIGTGLVLQNNRTDNLAVDHNGRFWFSTQMAQGSPCNVSVLSQPAAPIQDCRVVNGVQAINGCNIANLEVICVSSFQDTFDSEINADNWKSTAEFSRSLTGGSLVYDLLASSDFALSYLPFKDTSCGSVSLDVTITDATLTGTGSADFTTRLESCGYHNTTAGESPGNRAGDVFAAIVLKGAQSPFQAFYQVFRCLNNECGDNDSVELLTIGPGGDGYVPFGQVFQNDLTTLSIDWDNLNPGQFSFQLNNDPVVPFDPVAAGASMDAAQPNAPEKYFGLKVALSNPNDRASMSADFDNATVEGVLYDDFNTMTYLDGTAWSRTYGKVAIDQVNGQLVLETGKEHAYDPPTDNSFHSTDLATNNDLIPNADSVGIDVMLDSASTVIDNGGSPVEAVALVEITFRPPGSDETDVTDYTNNFYVQALLKQGPAGVTAETRAIGCADAACNAKHTDETQTFTTPVATDIVYQFNIERLGNGLVDIDLDSVETLTFDLSAYSAFAMTNFDRMKLKTQVRGTDLPGEIAFVRGRFDNARVANP